MYWILFIGIAIISYFGAGKFEKQVREVFKNAVG